jgi:intracellular sulfur oxidation DsrE/DsrF family protein
MDLVKIRLGSRGLGENQKMMNRELDQNQSYDHHLGANFASICWHARKFFICMANFKNGHLKKRVVDLVKMVDRGVVDLMKIRRFGSNH